MNISPTIKYPIDKKDCSFLQSPITCELFVQSVCAIQSLKEWFNLQAIELSQLDWSIQPSETNPIYIIPSVGNIEIKTKTTVQIKPSTHVNTIYYYHTEYPEECLSMVWFQLCSLLVSSDEYKQSIDCKLMIEEGLFKEFDPLLVDCIKNNTLQLINIDTCPSFTYLFQQTLKTFTHLVQMVLPPLPGCSELMLSFFLQPKNPIL